MTKSALKISLLAFTLFVLVSLVRLAAPQPAQAAAGFSVNTTNDTHDKSPGDGSCLDSSNNCSIRAALEEANASSSETTFTITLPAGTYTLSQGELTVAPNGNRAITINGAGASITTVSQGDGTNRVFNIDVNSTGGANVTLSGITITGGHDAVDSLGGAGILAGSLTNTPLDSLSLQNCAVTNNHISSSASTAEPGGGVQMSGGNLTVTNCTFSNNSAGSSPGGAIAFLTPAVDGALSIIGSTFTSNSVTNSTSSGSVGGGALFINSTATSVHTITTTAFTGNTSNGSSTGATFGGAILFNTGVLNIDHAIFSTNAASGMGGQGGAIYAAAGTLTVIDSRLTGNTAAVSATGIFSHTNNGAAATAVNNWWGCNGGPGATGCDSVVQDSGSPAVAPYIVLTNTASPTTIFTGQSTTLTASFLQNSAAQPLSAADVSALAGLPVTWNNALLGALSNPQTNIQASGTATAQFTAGAVAGTGHADARVDNGTTTANITINPLLKVYLPVAKR